MTGIGNQFLNWLSSQPQRTSSLSKAKGVVGSFALRHSVDEYVSKRLIWNLRCGGHIEKSVSPRARVTATVPALVVNSNTAIDSDYLSAEWIGARARQSLQQLTTQFDLTVDIKDANDGIERVFVSGQLGELQRAMDTISGTVAFNPGIRILENLPTLSPDQWSGESEAVPHSQPLQQLCFKNKRKHWVSTDFASDLPTGVYRINELPTRWLWHEQRRWTRLDCDNLHAAAWYQCHREFGCSLVYFPESSELKISRIGFPLPVLIDRALRLGSGPPAWSSKNIEYAKADQATVDQLLRLIPFRFQARNLSKESKS